MRENENSTLGDLLIWVTVLGAGTFFFEGLCLHFIGKDWLTPVFVLIGLFFLAREAFLKRRKPERVAQVGKLTPAEAVTVCSTALAFFPIVFLPGNTSSPLVRILLLLAFFPLCVFGLYRGRRKKEAETRKEPGRRRNGCGSHWCCGIRCPGRPGKHTLCVPMPGKWTWSSRWMTGCSCTACPMGVSWCCSGRMSPWTPSWARWPISGPRSMPTKMPSAVTVFRTTALVRIFRCFSSATRRGRAVPSISIRRPFPFLRRFRCNPLFFRRKTLFLRYETWFFYRSGRASRRGLYTGEVFLSQWPC